MGTGPTRDALRGRLSWSSSGSVPIVSLFKLWSSVRNGAWFVPTVGDGLPAAEVLELPVGEALELDHRRRGHHKGPAVVTR